jgi:protein-S-isoprenylcysteine O-methyltransferase Ste14
MVNPADFLGHVGQNLILAPMSLAGHTLAMDDGAFLGLSLAKLAGVSLIAGVLLSLVINRRRLIGAGRRPFRRWRRPPLVVAVAVLVLTIVAIALPQVVIYPRPHYMLVPIALLLVGLAALLSHAPDKRGQGLLPGLALLALSLAFAGQTLAMLPDRQSSPPDWERSIRALAESVSPVVMATAEGQICAYIPTCTALTEPGDFSGTFAEYLSANGATSVLYLPVLLDSPLGRLKEAQEFYDNPEGYGFRPMFDGSPIIIRSD